MKKVLKKNMAYLATDLLHHSVQEKKNILTADMIKQKYITERVKKHVKSLLPTYYMTSF
jgi:hypothetical protein